MLRKGQLVEVTFYDHVQHGKRPLRCVVYGKLSVVAPKSLTVDCWMLSSGSKAARENNVERFTIVRAAIEKVTRLRRTG